MTVHAVDDAATQTGTPTLAEFRAAARRWLDAHAEPRTKSGGDEGDWGVGSDSVAVFQNLSHDEERALLAAAAAWQTQKFDAGFGAIAWPVELGGAGLTMPYHLAFLQEESHYLTPTAHELFSVTVGLIAPTIAVHGTDEQKASLIPRLLRTDVMACQLFSEPGAGSDLASVATRAERDGDEWVINGQKVWTSGAQFAGYGELIARTDTSVPKHQGQTAFLVPLDTPGVDVRPIRQITGGTSFNEVFLTDVRVPDGLRLGGIGDGWRVALTTLAFERAGGAGAMPGGGSGGWRRVIELARHLGATDDAVNRQALADLYIRSRVLQLTGERIAGALRAGQDPGAVGSIAKLAWVQTLGATSALVSRLLGPRLVADSGEWGTYAWAEFVLGAPGYRIAGGSDEVQRNIIGERVLGLPSEPRVDRDVPFAELSRTGTQPTDPRSP